MKPNKHLDEIAVMSIRNLVIDMINKAKSGHPGMALGSAAILHTLFSRHMNIDPSHPNWMNRDRFVLSAGHASSLLYALLHLNGFKLSINDIKSFRQLGSLTPGHPENGHTEGVDATSGPLGQGIAQAVGMAMASEAIIGEYPEGNKLQDHYTYCLCGDGCLFEGISQEAISFAGHQKLNKLILFYDANQITLDGTLDLSFSESIRLRFLSAGWNVLTVKNGNHISSIDKAIIKAKGSDDQPTIIICNTTIGYGSANQGTNKVHGNPLGADDGFKAKNFYIDKLSSGAKKLLDDKVTADFYVLPSVYQYYKDLNADKGVKKHSQYLRTLEEYKNTHKEAYDIYLNLSKLEVSSYLPKKPTRFQKDYTNSTRNVSQVVLNNMMKVIPHLIGGSADVAHSVMTKLDNGTNFSRSNRSGHNVNFGIREFAMAAIQNGILLHGGLRTYVGSFLVFSDYMKSAVRHSSLSNLPSIYLFSHDSIAVGEDGPTHQPIEHLVMLRSIPNMNVIRPADANETEGAWRIALESTSTPTSLILSRQNLPLLENSDALLVKSGAYIVGPEKKTATYVILASGSEVSLALDAQKDLLKRGIDTRVVSVPCMEIFRKMPAPQREKIIGKKYSRRIAIEMLSPMCWYEFAPNVYGVNKFGASGKADEIIESYGFDVKSVVSYITKLK